MDSDIPIVSNKVSNASTRLLKTKVACFFQLNYFNKMKRKVNKTLLMTFTRLSELRSPRGKLAILAEKGELRGKVIGMR